MDSEELSEFRQLFSAVNVDSDESLRTWFEEYPELTNSEHCQITGKSLATITRYKNRAGVSPVYIMELEDGCHVTTKKPNKSAVKRREVQIKVPKDWETNRDWLESQYPKKVGLLALAQAIGCSKAKLYRIMADLGIRISSHKRSVKSNNKCCTREWVAEHYVMKRWSLDKCAKKAGVTKTTISQWLTAFGIESRSMYEMNLCHPSGSDGSTRS